MFELNEARFVDLLGKLIGESQHVQNNPPKFVPQEDKVIAHVLEALKPYNVENGGVLKVQHVHFKENRGNLIVEYRPEGASKIVSFIGSHLDVVPADPESWSVNPFKLSVDGDKLYGRGTTDCLGHIALLTDFLCTIGETKPKLTTNISVCFIASEENNTIPEIGVDMLLKNGYLDEMKKGPVFWIDSADTHPCIGTAGVTAWTLRAEGMLFHSGLPHRGINSIELAQDAIAEIQTRFYRDFPAHELEEKYKFMTPSTLKPTQIKCSEGSVNQLAAWCEIQGDVRLTPFYGVAECQKKIEEYVQDLNANLESLGSSERRGPCSKYILKNEEGNEVRRAKLSIVWDGEPFKGIACKLDSPGLAALTQATQEVIGEAKPYSLTGSLPLVGDMQEAGYDLQISGYGKSAVYHGNDEYCSLQDMKNAIKILSLAVDKLQ